LSIPPDLVECARDRTLRLFAASPVLLVATAFHCQSSAFLELLKFCFLKKRDGFLGAGFLFALPPLAFPYVLVCTFYSPEKIVRCTARKRRLLSCGKESDVSETSTVLVVDDEIGPRESLRAILKPEYKVLVATEGEQAVRLMNESPIDVVLLDLRMPGVSGIRVLERIKEINPDVEVILITGYASYETVLEALRLHAFDYIPKPFNIPHLRDMVRRAVTRRQSYARKPEHEDMTGDIQQKHPQVGVELAALQKALEDMQRVLSQSVQGPLQAIDEGSRHLAAKYIQQLDSQGQETLRRVRTAASTLLENLGSVLPQEIQRPKSSWSVTSTMATSSLACS
jgi:response regulator RpfG family c-di-GMP phosphodiesterase